MTEDVDINRRWWDERAALHGRDGFFYDVEAFLRGDDAITKRELAEIAAAIGYVAGADVLHLQCHIGLGTLTLARLGARVTGLDFSPVAIERARDLARQSGTHADFLLGDAEAVPGELHGCFDCVFASHGVLIWIADLDAWMRSAAAALRPGGKLVLVEGHPVSFVVRGVDPLVLEPPYQGGARIERMAGDYADRTAATRHDRAYHYRWSLGDVVTSAVRAGLRIDALTEWTDDEVGTPATGKITSDADGSFHLRVGGVDLPLVYALRATKP